MSGVVQAVNERLEAEPELVNSDPYGDGWIMRIELADPAEVSRLSALFAVGPPAGAVVAGASSPMSWLLARGFVLTCQSYPVSAEVTVDFDA